MKKLNIVDYILILVLALFLGLGVYKSIAPKFKEKDIPIKEAQTVQKSDVKATVSFKVKNIRKIACDKIKNNSVCEFKQIGYSSRVQNVKVENYYEYLLDDNCKYKKCDYGDRYTLSFDVPMTGDLKRSGFYVGGNAFTGVGAIQILTVNGVDFECVITNLKI